MLRLNPGFEILGIGLGFCILSVELRYKVCISSNTIDNVSFLWGHVISNYWVLLLFIQVVNFNWHYISWDTNFAFQFCKYMTTVQQNIWRETKYLWRIRIYFWILKLLAMNTALIWSFVIWWAPWAELAWSLEIRSMTVDDIFMLLFRRRLSFNKMIFD